MPEHYPVNIAGVSPDSETIKLTWEPPLKRCQNGKIEEYRIYYTSDPTQSMESSWATTHVMFETAAFLQGLEIFTEYTSCIAARTSLLDYGPCSKPPTVIRTLNDSMFFFLFVCLFLMKASF